VNRNQLFLSALVVFFLCFLNNATSAQKRLSDVFRLEAAARYAANGVFQRNSDAAKSNKILESEEPTFLLHSSLHSLLHSCARSAQFQPKYGPTNPSYITESEDQGWDGCNFQDRLFQPLTHPSNSLMRLRLLYKSFFFQRTI
jgi:hypothetical protein